MHKQIDAIVIGAGFNGLYQLYRLRQEGYSVQLLEAGPGLGGVWQNNRYPGARVDSHVPNYEFSLPEVWADWVWDERFPGRDELVRYFDHVADVLDLHADIQLNTRLTEAVYDDPAARWNLITDTGEAFTCSFLVLCTGFGSKPYIPDLPGLDAFAGEAHHTARWPEHGVEWAGKRVAVIGTGASGVQVTQEAAKVASHLSVFQRSPVTALPMQQRTLDHAEQQKAKVEYPEIFRRRNTPPGSFSDINRLNMSALEVSEDERVEVFEAAWQKGGFHFWVGTFKDVLGDLDANRLAYEFWRDKTRSRIEDPVTAQRLAPTDPPYPFGTKRPSLEQGFYECFNQPNVDLVDLTATPLETITATGIQTTDRHIDVDVLVLATGFDANTGGLTDINIVGRHGQTLADVWANGVDTHLGVAVAGFTNMLILYGPQSSTAFCNGPVCAEIQGDWVVEMLNHMRANELQRVESQPTADQEWSAHLADIADGSLFGMTNSWYMAANIPGKRRQLLNYPNSDAYLEHLARCAAGGYTGFVFR